MKISQLQHQDSIWTWGTKNAQRVSLWIPYVSKIEKVKKDAWHIRYSGGDIQFTVQQVDFILIYGDCGDLPIAFLDNLRQHKVPLIVHRRNIAEPVIFYAPIPNDDKDVLTQQILFRENQIKRCYIAKTLLHHRFKKFENIGLPIADCTYRKLNKSRNIKHIRNIEAIETKRYWGLYYHALGLSITRREKHPLNDALNAGSSFLMGIILRWILFHKMSPSHGFLHETTTYPSLVYDLMEPYRYIIETSAYTAYQNTDDVKKLTANTLSQIKKTLEMPIYCKQTQQKVRHKNLLHGSVLALRSYLIGDMKRLVLPTDTMITAGRPINVTYKIPGTIWEK